MRTMEHARLCHLATAAAIAALQMVWVSDPHSLSACPIDLVNCLYVDGDGVHSSDISSDKGIRGAEDFVAQASTITQLCIVGAYIDEDIPCGSSANPQRCDCACQDDITDPCIPIVTDQFQVRVYADADESPVSAEPSYPATLLHASEATSTRTLESQTANYDKWMTSLTLQDRVTDLQVGVTYWVEVINETTGALGNSCHWYWALEASTADGGGGNDWTVVNGSLYAEADDFSSGDARPIDHELCLDQGMVSPPPPTGACCVCDPLGDCVNGQTKAQCDDLGGSWRRFQTCEPGLCPTQPPPGDDCATDAIAIIDGVHAFTNECATTDGPPAVDSCPASDLLERGPVEFARDIWYFYTATCTGFIHVDMCADADFDAAVAIYSSGTETCICPSGSDQPDHHNDCGDDTCGVPAGPPIVVKYFIEHGKCYTIRVAGAGGDHGHGAFEIQCRSLGPYIPPTPIPDYSPVPVDSGFGGKNRYLSFSEMDSGRQEAIRVKFLSLPGYEYAEGRQMFVQEPYEVGEASGSPGPGAENFWAATLGCDPFYTDWSVYDRIDVHDDAIVPGGLYRVQAVSDNHSPYDELAYSNPLDVRMSAAGDVAGDCGVTPCTAPQGVVDFVDVSAVVEKFKNEPTALRKARADIINTDLQVPPPDNKVDFVDIACCIDAFRGQPCPLPGPLPDDPCIP
ncbi:MAG: hypothetical protein PVI86_01750 [Phycisphaerae bacterium]